MAESIRFTYYYGVESEQFSFYRVPRLLVKDKRFKGLSSDAKLLYGLMLDRMSLSMKNGWFDEQNRAYIIYTVESMMEDLGCSKPTCIKIMRELDTERGIGLIEKKRRGLGKPDIIYVKNFSVSEVQSDETLLENAVHCRVPSEVKDFYFKRENQLTSESKNTGLQAVKEADFRNKEIFTSESKGTYLAEVKEFAANYTEYNKTEINNINRINPSGEMETADRSDGVNEAERYRDVIRTNLEYDLYMQERDWPDRELFNELFEVICEIVCVKRDFVRIAGADCPYELVKSQFLKLNSSHLLYVINCMHTTTTKISNIKAYMLTALYNAPLTMNHYYRQEVQHDMHGGGWYDKGVI